MIKKGINNVVRGFLVFLILFGVSDNIIAFAAEPILRLYYIPFHIETFLPVTKDTLSKGNPIVFMKEHPFIPELLKSLQSHTPYKRVPSEEPTAPLEPLQREEDAERGNYRLKADFGSSVGIFWVTQGGGVMKDDGTRFFLTKKEMELLDQKIEYFRGVVDTGFISQIGSAVK